MGENLTSKPQRGGLMGLFTPRPTTLGPSDSLEKLRWPRRSQGRKGRNGGKEGGFYRNGKSYHLPWAWSANVTKKVSHLIKYGHYTQWGMANTKSFHPKAAEMASRIELQLQGLGMSQRSSKYTASKQDLRRAWSLHLTRLD